MAQHHELERDFVDYYKVVEGRPPRETLLYALSCFDRETSASGDLFAIDLGCGEGRDTVELLRRGWRVLGIDAQPEAIERLTARPGIPLERLQTQVLRFQDLATLPAQVDLINASFSLQFCPPADFPALWSKIVAALRPGGRFCGQLLGDRDSWAQYTNMNHHTLTEVRDLLQTFELEMFEEEDHPGKTALGEEKHWHIFQIVACKWADAL